MSQCSSCPLSCPAVALQCIFLTPIQLATCFLSHQLVGGTDRWPVFNTVGLAGMLFAKHSVVRGGSCHGAAHAAAHFLGHVGHQQFKLHRTAFIVWVVWVPDLVAPVFGMSLLGGGAAAGGGSFLGVALTSNENAPTDNDGVQAGSLLQHSSQISASSSLLQGHVTGSQAGPPPINQRVVGSLLNAPNGLTPSPQSSTKWQYMKPLEYEYEYELRSNQAVFDAAKVFAQTVKAQLLRAEVSPQDLAQAALSSHSLCKVLEEHPLAHSSSHSGGELQAACFALLAEASQRYSAWDMHAAKGDDIPAALAQLTPALNDADMPSAASMLCTAVLSGCPIVLQHVLQALPRSAVLSGECVLSSLGKQGMPWLNHLSMGTGPYHALCLVPTGDAASACLQLLLQAQVPLSGISDTGHTVAHAAAAAGNAPVLAAALGLSLDATCTQDVKFPTLPHTEANHPLITNTPPLQLAVWGGDVQCVRLLLQAGADPWWRAGRHARDAPQGSVPGAFTWGGQPCRVGVGPLAWAAALGRDNPGLFPPILSAAMQVLRQHARDEFPVAGDEEGGDAATSEGGGGATANRHEYIISCLCDTFSLKGNEPAAFGFGYQPGKKDVQLCSLLTLACASGVAGHITALLQAVPLCKWAPRLASVGVSMESVLLSSVREGRMSTVQCLLEHGVSVPVDAVLVAAESGDLRMLQALIDAEAPLNTAHGTCPALAVCLQRDDVRMARLLLAAGARALSGEQASMFPRVFAKYSHDKQVLCDSVLGAWVQRLAQLAGTFNESSANPPVPPSTVLDLLLKGVQPGTVHASQLPIWGPHTSLMAYLWSEPPSKTSMGGGGAHTSQPWPGCALLSDRAAVAAAVRHTCISDNDIGFAAAAMSTATQKGHPPYLGLIPRGHPMHLDSLLALQDPTTAGSTSGGGLTQAVSNRPAVALEAAALSRMVQHAVRSYHDVLVARLLEPGEGGDGGGGGELHTIHAACDMLDEGTAAAAALLLSLGGHLSPLLRLLTRRRGRGGGGGGDAPPSAAAGRDVAAQAAIAAGMLGRGGVPIVAPSAGLSQVQSTHSRAAAAWALVVAPWLLAGDAGAVARICDAWGGGATARMTPRALLDCILALTRNDQDAAQACQGAVRSGVFDPPFTPQRCNIRVDAGAFLDTILLQCIKPQQTAAMPAPLSEPANFDASQQASTGEDEWVMGLQGGSPLHGCLRALACGPCSCNAQLLKRWQRAVGPRASSDFNWARRAAPLRFRVQARGGRAPPQPPLETQAPTPPEPTPESPGCAPLLPRSDSHVSM